MPEDRSLDEFAVGSKGGGGQDDTEEAVDEAEETVEPVDDADETVDDADETVDDADETADAADETDDAAESLDDGDEAETADADPAVPTATWTTDGAACDRCGEQAARRWFADGDLVCAACKEW